MIRDPFALQQEMPLDDALREALVRHYPVYPVVDAAGKLTGLVRGETLFAAGDENTACATLDLHGLLATDGWIDIESWADSTLTASFGGTFLGESLFRMSNFWLEQGRGPRFWRELGAAAISPPVGFNRYAFGNRFKGIYPSHNPEYYARFAAGVSATTQERAGTTDEVRRNEVLIDFAFDYGLPGKSGYAYRRPFDYFAFQATAASGVGFESVTTRGLLFGTDYGRQSKRARGIWGLYGSYDYFAPQIFRLASSAVSVRPEPSRPATPITSPALTSRSKGWILPALP